MVLATDFIISAAECHKLMDSGAQGFLVNLTILDNEPTISEMPTVPPELEHLLEQFQDVFSPPSGLPPKRDIDHTIPPLPGAKPPNIRPYRLSHHQKDIMENLIRQMLQN